MISQFVWQPNVTFCVHLDKTLSQTWCYLSKPQSKCPASHWMSPSSARKQMFQADQRGRWCWKHSSIARSLTIHQEQFIPEKHSVNTKHTERHSLPPAINYPHFWEPESWCICCDSALACVSSSVENVTEYPCTSTGSLLSRSSPCNYLFPRMKAFL